MDDICRMPLKNFFFFSGFGRSLGVTDNGVNV